MKTLVLTWVASLLAVPALSNDLSGNKGFCSVLMCSSRRLTDVDAHVAKLKAQHPSNTAVGELATALGAKGVPAKRAALVKFFAFREGLDATEMEKRVEHRLNDGQADKISNDDARKLVSILNGENE